MVMLYVVPRVERNNYLVQKCYQGETNEQFSLSATVELELDSTYRVDSIIDIETINTV